MFAIDNLRRNVILVDTDVSKEIVMSRYILERDAIMAGQAYALGQGLG